MLTVPRLSWPFPERRCWRRPAAGICLDIRFSSRVLKGFMTMERLLGGGQPADRCFGISLEQFNRLFKDVRDAEQAFRLVGGKTSGSSATRQCPIGNTDESDTCNLLKT